MKGDITGLDEFISPKCTGVLGAVRDGKATAEQIDDLKKLFNGLKQGSAPRNENGTWALSVRNGDNATIAFRVKKEGDTFKVIEMTVKPGTSTPKKKG